MPPSDPELELPEPLRRALRRRGPTQEVPAEFDREVLAGAGPALARARARHRRRRVTLVALPLAAAAALLLWLRPETHRSREAAPELGARREDLDRNGRVDILDAFQLAREIERGGTPFGRDFNGDGRVDGDDVDHLAHLAVRLRA